jgi:chromosome partitioning related protein ParA
MIKIAVVSTKGGVGKTTLTANLGGLLADMGFRVLMIDADVQPSLSRFFRIRKRAELSLTAVLRRGMVTEDNLSEVDLPGISNLHIICSDAPDGEVQHWLSTRLDRGRRMAGALRSGIVLENYDFVLLDTQGAKGPLQDAAALAADILLSPIAPDVLSAREFLEGTIEFLRNLETADMPVGQMKALIYRQERTVDARTIATTVRENFVRFSGRVDLLNSVVPSAVVFKEAATKKLPVHMVDVRRRGASPCALETMMALAYELIPSLALSGVRPASVADALAALDEGHPASDSTDRLAHSRSS